MKVCVHCDARFSAPDWRCPKCGRTPETIGSHLAFAPALARDNPGFDQTHFADLARLEADNFWFRARNQLIVWALGTYFPAARSFLEVGCGTGFVLSAIEAAFPELALYGSEAHAEGLSFAASRTRRAELFQMDARHIPFEGELDLIGAFDVIEHIDDDAAALASMYRALTPGGGLLVTVPQHAWLWSKSDDYAHHCRRYDRAGLQARLEGAGFQVKTMTSFVSLLLPPMLASRLAQRLSGRPFNPEGEYKIGRLPNLVFERVLAAERGLIRLGLRLPVGGSLLAVAEKPANA